jgi:hypothetical protein
MEKVNRKKLTILLCVATALLTILFCLFSPVKEHSVFSIPTHTSADKLEQEGFVLNYRHMMPKAGEKAVSAWLPFGENYSVIVNFDPEGSGSWEKYRITTNAATFHRLTGMEPKDYTAIGVDGYDYRVTVVPGGLVLERLGM